MKPKLAGWGFISEVNKTSFSQALSSFSHRLENFPNGIPKMNCYGDSYAQWPGFIVNYMLEHARPVPSLSGCESVLAWFNNKQIDIFLPVSRRPPEKAYQSSHKNPQSLLHMLWNKRGKNIQWPEHIMALKNKDNFGGIPAERLWRSFRDWYALSYSSSSPIIGREPHWKITRMMQQDNIALPPKWISDSLAGAGFSPEPFLSRVGFINKHYAETFKMAEVWKEPKKIKRVIGENVNQNRYASLWLMLSSLPKEIYQHVEPIFASRLSDEWVAIHQENHLSLIAGNSVDLPRIKI